MYLFVIRLGLYLHAIGQIVNEVTQPWNTRIQNLSGQSYTSMLVKDERNNRGTPKLASPDTTVISKKNKNKK